MPLDDSLLRAVLGRFATGVTVVTARDDEGRALGLTVNAFLSVSLDPPLVLVSLSAASATRAAILETGAFAVNVLAEDDEALAVRFSRGRRAVRFRGIDASEARTGSPVLARALAWLDCEVRTSFEAGDHTLVLGEPLETRAREGRPLLFYESRFREVAR